MSDEPGRYVKNYNVDGWPVHDTAERSDLSKDDVIDRLNKQEQIIKNIVRFVSSDSTAIQFQSLGQYRKSLSELLAEYSE